MGRLPGRPPGLLRIPWSSKSAPKRDAPHQRGHVGRARQHRYNSGTVSTNQGISRPTYPFSSMANKRDPINPAGTLQAVNPRTKEALDPVYPVSSRDDVDAALVAAQAAVRALRDMPPDRIAAFLEAYAANIEARAEEICRLADTETALGYAPRMRDVELPGPPTSCARPRPPPETVPGCRRPSTPPPTSAACSVPWPDRWSSSAPITSRSPFNSVSGGDFAAAIAAGNPVIGKANTGHPGTTKLLAEAALDAIHATGMPRALVQLIYRTPRRGPHPGLPTPGRRTGFTGSKAAGLKLKAAADEAGKPIYLEMSSVNPIFVLPGVLRERGAEVAQELYASCALGAGQFCTNPGLTVVLDSPESDEFIAAVDALFAANPPQTLLGPGGPRDIDAAVERLTAGGATVLTGGRPVDEPGLPMPTRCCVDGDHLWLRRR
ncbi:MAG: aldehyde dehydrogenase family protein [Caldilineaceae bacterium]